MVIGRDGKGGTQLTTSHSGKTGADTNKLDAGTVREEFFRGHEQAKNLLSEPGNKPRKAGRGLPVCLYADRALLSFGGSLLENLKATTEMVYH